MGSLAIQVYHRLPAPLRDVAATVRGRKLQAWRYGPETDRLAQEALDREHWSAAQWDAWRSERLRFVLERAATLVPWYRDYWTARRASDPSARWDRLSDWPLLEKDALREDPRAFVAEDADPARLAVEHTSGTTGKSLDLWISHETTRAWYAIFEARWRRWHGVSRHDRWAILGGQLIAPVSRRTPPFWAWNAAMHQLYMSAYHLAPDLIPHYLDALLHYRVRYLWGYTSALCALATEALRLGRHDLRMAVAITNAEPVFDYQRAAIEEAFHCPVRATYGMSEMVAAAGECEHGTMHSWPEAGVIEVLADGHPAAPGEAGELVCTGLVNADMPLIRYRVGDCGAVAPEPSPCPCGRSLPVLASLTGRTDDVLFTRDGRHVGRLDPVFKASLPVREAQIIQESLDRVRVLVVPSERYTEDAGASIVEQLRQRMGPVSVSLEPVAEIPRGANGKFRAVVCHIPPEERPNGGL